MPCVVAAFSLARRHHLDATLRIVGKNGLGDELFSITRGVTNCEVVDEFLPPLALAEELERAQVCIFAYTEASHSGGAELALAFGCNVVATKVAAFNSVADVPGVFLFEPGNVRNCAEALSKALDIPKRAKDLAAIQHVTKSNEDRACLFLDQVKIAPANNLQ
jgi:glycosyltransferase involved in cell wall biosynthesis